MKFIAGIFVVFVLILLIGAAVIYFGAYDVAATTSDASLARWALNTTMIHSVKSRAGSLQAPDQFTEDQVRTGFTEFNDMCITCHGAPARSEATSGKD